MKSCRNVRTTSDPFEIFDHDDDDDDDGGGNFIMTMLTYAQLVVELEPSQRWHDHALVPGSEPEATSLPPVLSFSMRWTQNCGVMNLHFTSD